MHSPVDFLRGTCLGPVVGPGDTGYFGGPAAIVYPADAADVVCVMAAAADSGLRVTVDEDGDLSDAVLLCMAALDGVTIDPRARTVRCGAGARQDDIARAAAVHGFVPAAEVAFELVTPAGEFVRTDDRSLEGVVCAVELSLLPAPQNRNGLPMKRLTLAVIAALFTIPSAASASTVAYDGDTLVLRGAPGEVNQPSVQDHATDGWVALYDGGTTITELPAGCEDHRDYNSVSCPAARVRLELGDGDDWGTISFDVTAPVDMHGGPGDDRLEGNELANSLSGDEGDDRINGYEGDDLVDGGAGADSLEGYSGADRVLGGDGDDLLMPDGYEAASADYVDGGAGTDRIESDYSTRKLDDPEPAVAFTLGGGADDGRPGEGDDIRGVERLILSKGATVVGTDGAEYVKLHQVGDDGALQGNGGDDELRGGDGADRIDGGAGADVLDGGFGDDHIVGGPGADRISADLAGGDCGPLWCKYPYGNDVVDARDGEADSITCGAGEDRAVVDTKDTVAADCETVERPGGGEVTPGATVSVAALPGQKLKRALRKGLKVRVSGYSGAVSALRKGRTVATGSGTGTVTLRFKKAARRSLKRKRSITLELVAG